MALFQLLDFAMPDETATLPIRSQAARARVPARRPARSKSPDDAAQDDTRTLSNSDLRAIAHRIRNGSRQPALDLAVFWLIASCAAKPIEAALLTVKDVFDVRGDVRAEATVPQHPILKSPQRILYLTNECVRDALTAYAEFRVQNGWAVSSAGQYAGLDPGSRLLLTARGEPCLTLPKGKGRRLDNKPMLAAYTRVYHMSPIEGLRVKTFRRTLLMRLFRRGASTAQLMAFSGISDRRFLDELLGVHDVPLAALAQDLVGDTED